ncbi:hypothetical protein [Polaromonas sp. C04]|uniref:hypothetical protein n=1 Tax=Polaromonas sp. C04 TaxID=1945857 RepID=UPI0009843B2E|nr:hypothetical protein [Polaromonas sp. C04]OOG52003.1 hypothetical protein B0E49_14075 [Polaromonas sp. C04]
MYLIVIGWIYVTLMMAVAEAASSTGTLLGGIATFVFYGLAPMALLVYLMGSPARRRAIKAREAAAGQAEAASSEPDAGGQPPAAAEGEGVAPVRKEP